MFRTSFDTTRYGPAIAELLGDGQRLMPLGQGKHDRDIEIELRRFDPFRHIPGQIRDPQMIRALVSTLWLYHDFLEESHAISQELETTTGSLLHGIMHRREPDPFNAKYWFRKVGLHPIYADLGQAAKTLGWKDWQPALFVDLCEEHRGSNSKQEATLMQIQQTEWQVLFDYCFNEAVRPDSPVH